jgi:hypothetical protein
MGRPIRKSVWLNLHSVAMRHRKIADTKGRRLDACPFVPLEIANYEIVLTGISFGAVAL